VGWATAAVAGTVATAAAMATAVATAGWAAGWATAEREAATAVGQAEWVVVAEEGMARQEAGWAAVAVTAAEAVAPVRAVGSVKA